VPTLPANAVVTIDFGFNGTDLFQVGRRRTRSQGQLRQRPGGVGLRAGVVLQRDQLLQRGVRLERREAAQGAVPGYLDEDRPDRRRPGHGPDCPVTRNFDMVDQDPSDNVTTEYLLNPLTGQTAQDTTANAGNIAGATLLLNGSDNTLLDQFIDPVLGCTPFEAPDLANNDQPTSSQALDELLAGREPAEDRGAGAGERRDGAGRQRRVRRGQDRPVPGGTRPGADQRQNNKTSSPAMYCQNLVDIQTPFLAANQTLLATGQSPVTGGGRQPAHLPGERG
jgi:hypothetical protein